LDTTAVLYAEDDEADTWLMRRAWQRAGPNAYWVKPSNAHGVDEMLANLKRIWR